MNFDLINAIMDNFFYEILNFVWTSDFNMMNLLLRYCSYSPVSELKRDNLCRLKFIKRIQIFIQKRCEEGAVLIKL